MNNTKSKLQAFYNFILAKSNANSNLLETYRKRLEIMKSINADNEYKQIALIDREIEEITTLFVNLFSDELQDK